MIRRDVLTDCLKTSLLQKFLNDEENSSDETWGTVIELLHVGGVVQDDGTKCHLLEWALNGAPAAAAVRIENIIFLP